MKKRKPVKPKCPGCGSSHVLFTRKDKKYWCRVCGTEWDKR